MSQLFITRPILATVCSLLIMLCGVIAIPTLPIARFPELTPPGVSVSAFYTGANAQEVETAVTTPLEQAINGVEGMLYMSSSSTNSGVATISVTFDVTRDQDLAALRARLLARQHEAAQAGGGDVLQPREVEHHRTRADQRLEGRLEGVAAFMVQPPRR